MRRVLILGSVFILAVALSACARPTPTPAATPTPTPIKGEGELILYNQSIAQTPMEEIGGFSRFEAETGCKVTSAVGRSTDMLARITAEKAAPSIDVVSMDSAPLAKGRMLGLLEKNDPNIVTNLKEVFEGLRPKDNVGTPFLTYVVALLVRTDKLAASGCPEPTSWLDVANPCYKGKVGHRDFTATSMQAAFMMVNLALGGDYDNVEPVKKWYVEKLKPNVVVGAAGMIRDMFTTGDLWIGFETTLFILQSRNAGLPMKAVFPKEGVAGSFIGYQAVKGAPHPTCAQFWLDFTLSKYVQDQSERFGAAPVRMDAKQPGPDILPYVGYYPLIKDKWVELDDVKIAERAPAWTEWFDKNMKK